ncbi:hypothetical protein Q7P35_001168 [Cladosporium inversicolor]
MLILPTTPSHTIIEQFKEVIRQGYKYLQSGSRSIAICLLATIVLTYYHPDEAVAAKWKWYAAAFAVLIQAAWYEVVFVFPINDRANAMGEKSEGDDLWLTDSEHERLHGLIRSWRWWHFGRIVAAFVPGCLTLAALL